MTAPAASHQNESVHSKSMPTTHTIGQQHYQFADLRTLLAKASPLRSGDQLAGVAAADAQERWCPMKSTKSRG